MNEEDARQIRTSEIDIPAHRYLEARGHNVEGTGNCALTLLKGHVDSTTPAMTCDPSYRRLCRFPDLHDNSQRS